MARRAASRRRPTDRQAENARWAQALEKVIGEPATQLEWLLHFVDLDLQTLSVEGWRNLWDQLAFLIARAPSGSALPPRLASALTPSDTQAVADAQWELREFFTSLARNHSYETRQMEGRWAFLRLEHDGRRERIPLHRIFFGPLPWQVVLTAAALLDRAGPDRLRACPFTATPAGQSCAKLFLAKRRQKFCSGTHAQQAAWNSYWSRMGGTRAKR